MAKVALISLYEANYLGTRVLSSYLIKNGHEAHNILFKDLRWETRETPLEKHHGYQCMQDLEIVTLEYDSFLWTEAEEKLFRDYLAELNPDIIGISTRSPLEHMAEALAHAIKEACPSPLLIAGGYGPTLETEKFLNFGFDAVIRGDGEETLLSLANRIDRHEDWTDLPNLACFKDGRVSINPLVDQVKDLAAYPPPSFDDESCSFIDYGKLYRNSDPHGLEGAPISTRGLYCTYLTRGCVNSCSYCSGGLWADLYKNDGAKFYRSRKRDLGQVISELEAIDRKRFSYIYFVDECNTLTTGEIHDFFGEYKKKIGLPFTIYMNYRKVLDNPELLEYVIDCGLDSTAVGVQTGSESFAYKYFTRKNSNRIYQDYIDLLFKSYVTSKIQLIGGHSEEDEETFSETLDLIKSFPSDPLDRLRMPLVIFRLKAFPKAPLVEIAPRTLSDPMPAKEWWRRALLMDMRQFATDSEMDYARSNRDFSSDPALLKAFAKDLLHRKQLELMDEKLTHIDRNNVFFFGAGKSLDRNREYFKDRGIRPKAILVDEPYLGSLPKEIEGIPVISPDQAGDDLKSAHTFIFARNSGAVYRNLIRNFRVDPGNLSACVTGAPLI